MLSFKATRESKNEQMCKNADVLNANLWKYEWWYLDYIEISSCKPLSILYFAWQLARLQVKAEVGFGQHYFYFYSSNRLERL